MGDNSDKKKIRVIYFFMRNPYMKFQNTSMHCSKVMRNKIELPEILKRAITSKFFIKFVENLIR